MATIVATLHIFFSDSTALLWLWAVGVSIGSLGAFLRWSDIKSRPVFLSFVLLAAGLLFVSRNIRRAELAEEDWGSVYPGVVADLKRKVDEAVEGHFEERLRLVEDVGEEVRMLSLQRTPAASWRKRLFETLGKYRSAQSDGDDLFFLLRDADGNEIAWSGDRYLPRDISSISPTLEDSLSIRIYRGNIITAAVINRMIPGVGVLTVSDHLGIRHHLSRRYARRGRFIDRLSSAVGSEISFNPPDDRAQADNDAENLRFPLLIHRHRVGTWSTHQVSPESFISGLKNREERYFPLMLLIPWLVSILILRGGLSRSPVNRDGERSVGRWSYIVTLGFFLYFIRVSWLEYDFPSVWIGGELFSPRFFASGLLRSGSISIGEFFISSLFICLFTIHIFPLLLGRDDSRNDKRARRIPKRLASLALCLFLAFSTPFVLERLFRETLSSIVIDQAFIGSMTAVLWESCFFLLLVPLILLVTVLIRQVVPRGVEGPGRMWVGATVSLLLFSAAWVMAGNAYGDQWGIYFAIVEGALILIGGSLFVGLTEEGVEGGGRVGALPSLPGVIFLSLLSAGVIYPAMLRYRHLALEETGESLMEQLGAPYDDWATFVLEEVTNDLLDRKDEIFGESRDPKGLGFYAWANSRLSTLGQRTSLFIYDGNGRRISRFSLTKFEPDSSLSRFFLNRAREEEEPFIYHGFSAGKEFYTSVIPYWEGNKMKSYLTVTLPTDIEERLGGRAVKFFLDESEKGRFRMPRAMTLRVRPAGEGTNRKEAIGWRSESDGNGRYRYLQRRMKIGGLDKSVEVKFRLMGLGESSSRINVLFLLHLCLMIVLWGILNLGSMGKLRHLRMAVGTFRRRLILILIVFSVIPTLIFGAIGAREIRLRLDAETRARAVEGLERFIEMVRRDLQGSHGPVGGEEVRFYNDKGVIYGAPGHIAIAPGSGLKIDNQYLREVAETMGQDFLVFYDNRLVATSQEDLARAGMIPGTMSETSYVDLAIDGKSEAFHRQSLGNYQYLVADRRISPAGSDPAVFLSTPLLWRQEEVDQEVAGLNYLVLMVITGIIFLSVTMGIVVGRRLSRPISDLKEAFEKVGESDFRVDLEKGRQDEFGRLFSSFEAMAMQLEKSQKSLSEEKARVVGVFQAVGAGIMAFGKDGTLRVVNSKAEELLGEDLGGRIGSSLDDLSFHHEGWEKLLLGIHESFRSVGGDVEREFEVAEGERVRMIRMIASGLVDESGGNQGVVVAFEDISDTVRSQKIMAWGEMARQVAHEIKNPLTPIRLSIQHLYKTYKDNAPNFGEIIEEEVRVILREIDRLRRIASDFSRYAKPLTEEVRRVDAASVLSEVRELYERGEGDLNYDFMIPEGRVPALASEEGLKKVLVNLIENGRAAIDGPGRLESAVRVEEDDGIRWVVLTVTDSGRGIPESDLGRIFDPNFSTRTGGTGLGLAICKRIVEGWGGTIHIWSRQGEGTRVEVRLRGA
jgi:PAS domain S-box-containing protein